MYVMALFERNMFITLKFTFSTFSVSNNINICNFQRMILDEVCLSTLTLDPFLRRHNQTEVDTTMFVCPRCWQEGHVQEGRPSELHQLPATQWWISTTLHQNLPSSSTTRLSPYTSSPSQQSRSKRVEETWLDNRLLK